MNALSLPVAFSPFYPGIVTARFYETWDFYTTRFGFRTVTEFDHYVQLEHPSGARLSLVKEELDGQPSELVSATEGRGFWLCLEVADAEIECRRLRLAGVPIVRELVEMSWSERNFVARDPNGVLIFIAQKISAPSPAIIETEQL